MICTLPGMLPVLLPEWTQLKQLCPTLMQVDSLAFAWILLCTLGIIMIYIWGGGVWVLNWGRPSASTPHWSSNPLKSRQPLFPRCLWHFGIDLNMNLNWINCMFFHFTLAFLTHLVVPFLKSLIASFLKYGPPVLGYVLLKHHAPRWCYSNSMWLFFFLILSVWGRLSETTWMSQSQPVSFEAEWGFEPEFPHSESTTFINALRWLPLSAPSR